MLPPIPDDAKVWVSSGETAIPGQIASHVSTPRSYIVTTPKGQIRRNSHHLNVIPNNANDDQPPSNSNLITWTPHSFQDGNQYPTDLHFDPDTL